MRSGVRCPLERKFENRAKRLNHFTFHISHFTLLTFLSLTVREKKGMMILWRTKC